MERCRKMVSWMALGAMLIGNALNPWTYASENGDAENLLTEKSVEDFVEPEILENTENDEEISEVSESLNQGKEILNLEIMDNNLTPEDCFEWNGTNISKYICNYENIVIPAKTYYVYGEAFAGKTITSITFLNTGTYLGPNIFSGAVIEGEMTFPGELKSHDSNYLESLNIGTNGKVIITEPTSTYRMTVRGELSFEFPDDGNTYTLNYGLNSSLIDGGKVFIAGTSYGISYLMQYSTMTEGSSITIGEGVHVLDHSFYSGNYNGIINLPESLERITNNSFTKSKINNNFKFGSGLKEIAPSAFYDSNISGNFLFENNEEQLEVRGFGYSYITGNIEFYNSNVKIEGFGDSKINGNVKFENCTSSSNSAFSSAIINGNFKMQGGNGDMSHRGSMDIAGNFEVIGDNYLGDYPGKLNVGNNILISSNGNFSLKYGGSPRTVGGDVILSGNNFDISYGTLSNLNISGDFSILSNNQINISSAMSSNIKVYGDIYLSGNEINIVNSLRGIDVLGNLGIKGNITKDGNSLEGKTKDLIINQPQNNISNLTILGDLIILDSDNAQAEEFSGISVGRNIYLSGEISKVGANAYKFSSGNIQPITLSPTFSTGDIGENAFCMEGKPLVVAYTKKKLTQAEKEYLRTHACLNAMGTYILTFKSGDRTETLEYDGRNLNQIPVRERTGYEFLGWHETGTNEIFDFTGTEILEDKTFYAKWKANTYTVSFDTNGGNEISPISVDCDTLFSGIALPKPTRECNEFSGWENLPETMPAHDIILKAVWNYTCSTSSGGGGGAKKTESTTREVAVVTTTEQEHNSADEQKSETPETSNVPSNGEINTPSSEETSNQVISVTQEVSEDGTIEAVVETIKIKNTDIVATVRTEVSSNSTSNSSSKTHTKEENDAYSFAKSNGITTTSSIDTAKMNTELTRIQMAKMLSNYAINVLGQEPDVSKGTVKFSDVTSKMDKQYDNAVTKAYQLGIMGQNVKNNEFRPNDTVTRAEFASALSRLLYHTEEGNYKGTGKYYIPHVAKLYNEGIINKADPKIKEKRGYVMTMLKRTVE